MSAPCADLDPFFDGELSKEEARTFRVHLATCERCEAVLRGRMQEKIVAEVAHQRVGQPRAIAIEPAHRDVRRHRIVILAPLLAAAAAVVIWLVVTREPEQTGTESREKPASDEVVLGQPKQGNAKDSAVTLASNEAGSKPIEVSLTIEHDSAIMRGTTAHAGDVLRIGMHGDHYRAIWVYLGDRDLVAACPGSAQCDSRKGELTLELRVPAPGQYSIIALTSAEPVMVPHGTLDVMLSAATAAGANIERRYIEVH